MLKLVKKNQSGGVSATDLFYYWNTEQNMYHADIVGRWQARSNGKTGANTGLIQNETILADLAPFTIPYDITITGGDGLKPEDFIFRLNCRINESNVTFINHDQLAAVLKSVIDPPSIDTDTYYAIEYGDYYKFFPSDIEEASMNYVASCNDIKWGFTFDAQGRQVYNPGTSVQPKWSTPTIIEITKRCLANFGVAVKDSDFTNAGRSAQATGN